MDNYEKLKTLTDLYITDTNAFLDLISNYMSMDELGDFVEYIQTEYDLDDEDFL